MKTERPPCFCSSCTAGEWPEPDVNPAWPLLHVARPTSKVGPPLTVNLMSAARWRPLR